MHFIRRQCIDLLPGAALAFALSFLTAIYAPLELYFTNLDEFGFDFQLLFPPMLFLFLAMLAAGITFLILSRLLYIHLYDAILAVGLITYLCAYVHGMFLSGNLPPLDGTRIDWSAYNVQSAFSILVCALIFVAVVLLLRFLHITKFRRLVLCLSLFLTAVLFVTCTTVGIANQGFRHKTRAVVTQEHICEYSSSENLVIFVIDALDSRTFQQMLDNTNPDFSDILQDFTYYPDTVGAYPYTRESIPFILSGQWYEHEQAFPPYYTSAMEHSPLLSSLAEQDYRCAIYEDDLPREWKSERIYDIENISGSPLEVISKKQLCKDELKLVWFKYAPFPLKRLSHIRMEGFDRNLRLPDHTARFSSNNRDYYTALSQSEFTAVPEKCFRFIHIEGAHVPFRYDRNVNYIDESDGTYEQNIEASMTIVSLWLQKLKDAGLYDNTAIVLMADHGYGHNRDVAILGRGNPFLAAKGIGEHHPLTVSDAPISYEDLQEAYGRLLSGSQSDALFDAVPGQPRRRRLLLYEYQHEYHMEEYVQTGHAFDLETLVPTGTVYEAPRWK